MTPEKLPSQLLSILFVASKPVTLEELAESLEIEISLAEAAVKELSDQMKDSGINVLFLNGKVELSSHPENSHVVKKFLSLELREKLTDASLETLAIIVYRQPISKADLENIRGVNSQYILRQLLIRGLVEKIGSDTDKRLTLYRPTLELMQHLGIKDIKDLPDFEELTKGVTLPEGNKEDSN